MSSLPNLRHWFLGCIFAMHACSSGAEVAGAESLDKASRPQASIPALSGTAGVLQSYERLRHSFAEDRVAEGLELAKELAARAQGLTSKANSAPQLGAIAAAAAALGKLAPKQDALARKAFGEVSRSVVELVSRDETLRKGLYLFECPMAEEFKQWVQTDPKIENPYMGSKMLRCGAKRDF